MAVQMSNWRTIARKDEARREEKRIINSFSWASSQLISHPKQ